MNRIHRVLDRRGRSSSSRRWLGRSVGDSVGRFAPELLGVNPNALYSVSRRLDPISALGMAVHLGAVWRTTQHLAAGSGGSIAAWGTMDRGDGSPPVLTADDVAGHYHHDGQQVVVAINPERHDGGCVVQVYARRDAPALAGAALSSLLDSLQGRSSPLFGLFLDATCGPTVSVAPKTPPRVSAADVHLPPGTWERLDRAVLGTLSRVSAVGNGLLGGPRGVLLHGPPGTGKSSICKVLAGRAIGEATVVYVSRLEIALGLHHLYEWVARVAPALVILEDVDTVASRRRGPAAFGLAGFLNALDGLATRNVPIVTLMTTNDPKVLDAAASRAGRIDVFIEIPRPGRPARAAILDGLLRGLDHTIDVDRLARFSEGLTAADLRELVRAAVMDGDHIPTTPDLTDRLTGTCDDTPIGLYL